MATSLRQGSLRGVTTLSYLMHCCIELHPTTYWHFMTSGDPKGVRGRWKAKFCCHHSSPHTPNLYARHAHSFYSKRSLNTRQMKTATAWRLVKKRSFLFPQDNTQSWCLEFWEADQLEMLDSAFPYLRPDIWKRPDEAREYGSSTEIFNRHYQVRIDLKFQV